MLYSVCTNAARVVAPRGTKVVLDVPLMYPLSNTVCTAPQNQSEELTSAKRWATFVGVFHAEAPVQIVLTVRTAVNRQAPNLCLIFFKSISPFYFDAGIYISSVMRSWEFPAKSVVSICVQCGWVSVRSRRKSVG